MSEKRIHNILTLTVFGYYDEYVLNWQPENKKVFADGTVADPAAHKANPDLYADVSTSIGGFVDVGDSNKDSHSKFAAPAQVWLMSE